MSDTKSATVETVDTVKVEEDDWLSDVKACSIENGEDCEACQ